MILDDILEATHRRVAQLDERALEKAPRRWGPVRDFAGALRGPGLQVIAEIKRRSPSAGPLAPDIDPVARAAAYTAGGAAAISVLTEPDFFDGSIEDLEAVRSSVGVPVLRKDFTIHPAQIWEARVAGADAVLLIVAALDDTDLAALLATARNAGLAAIVEVHTIDEAARARGAGATIIGVNNRDLTTFATDLATAESIAPHIADVPLRIAESGVSTREGAQRMASAGYHAVLVGEALVRAAHPEDLVNSLRSTT